METLLEWLKEHLKGTKWGTGFLALIVLGGLATFFLTTGKEELEAIPPETVILANSAQEDTIPEIAVEAEGISSETVPWKVDIKGAVLFPDVYEVETGMRIQDLIDKAGGLRPDAEARNLNLAQLLEDQMMVYVPISGEHRESSSEGEDGDASSSLLVYTPSDEKEESGLINLNTADQTQLQELNGIGEKKADLIIQYRKEHGPFQAIEELMNVKGIGEKTFEALKEQVLVSVE